MKKIVNDAHNSAEDAVERGVEFMKQAIFIIALASICACATESRGFPMQAWATPASVAYWFDPVLANMGGVNQGHAAIKAQAYCQTYSKNARLSLIRPASGQMSEVVFDCVAP